MVCQFGALRARIGDCSLNKRFNRQSELVSLIRTSLSNERTVTPAPATIGVLDASDPGADEKERLLFCAYIGSHALAFLPGVLKLPVSSVLHNIAHINAVPG